MQAKSIVYRSMELLAGVAVQRVASAPGKFSAILASSLQHFVPQSEVQLSERPTVKSVSHPNVEVKITKVPTKPDSELGFGLADAEKTGDPQGRDAHANLKSLAEIPKPAAKSGPKPYIRFLSTIGLAATPTDLAHPLLPALPSAVVLEQSKPFVPSPIPTSTERVDPPKAEEVAETLGSLTPVENLASAGAPSLPSESNKAVAIFQGQPKPDISISTIATSFNTMKLVSIIPIGAWNSELKADVSGRIVGANATTSKSKSELEESAQAGDMVDRSLETEPETACTLASPLAPNVSLSKAWSSGEPVVSPTMEGLAASPLTGEVSFAAVLPQTVVRQFDVPNPISGDRKPRGQPGNDVKFSGAPPEEKIASSLRVRSLVADRPVNPVPLLSDTKTTVEAGRVFDDFPASSKTAAAKLPPQSAAHTVEISVKPGRMAVNQSEAANEKARFGIADNLSLAGAAETVDQTPTILREMPAADFEPSERSQNGIAASDGKFGGNGDRGAKAASSLTAIADESNFSPVADSPNQGVAAQDENDERKPSGALPSTAVPMTGASFSDNPTRNASPAAGTAKDGPSTFPGVTSPSPYPSLPMQDHKANEVPPTHQMLDAAPAPETVRLASMTPNSTANMQMNARMKVGLHTDAFGAIEIHTVVQQSQVGITVHADRELARWFSSELPGLESGLSHNHLQLAAVDFDNSRPGAQTGSSFQQQHQQQQLTASASANFKSLGSSPTSSEENADAEHGTIECVPPALVLGRKQIRLSIHV